MRTEFNFNWLLAKHCQANLEAAKTIPTPPTPAQATVKALSDVAKLLKPITR